MTPADRSRSAETARSVKGRPVCDMRQSWLIQRLEKPFSFGQFKDNPYSFGGGLKNGGLSGEAMDLIRGIFSFDYMGAAEFEFGAVPKALGRIADRHDRYVSFTLTVPLVNVPRHWRDKSDETPTGQAIIYGLAEDAAVPEVAKRITEWATKPHARLKEQTHLPDSLRPSPEYPTRVCGWLELDNAFFFFTDEEMWRRTADLFGIEAQSARTATPRSKRKRAHTDGYPATEKDA